jgi:anthranilate synthase/aminodeoxychorismate synthase-like glutamine amidotransferase
VILLLDNYDSFVHNLARYVRELGGEPLVRRNDAVTLNQISTLGPTHIIISPGPCTPVEAGVSVEVIRRFGPTIPTLGVCLGHQCIGAAYGGRVVRAGRPMHGKTSRISHEGTGIFRGLPSPFVATRYHSLALERPTLPPELRVTASSEDGEIMAIRHAEHPVVGTQFHPESVLTEHGHTLLRHFLEGDPHAS